MGCSFLLIQKEFGFVNSEHFALKDFPSVLAGVKVLSMLVPALVGYLLDNTTQQIAKHQRLLHDHSLQWLTKIGPQYPQVSLFAKNI